MSAFVLSCLLCSSLSAEGDNLAGLSQVASTSSLSPISSVPAYSGLQPVQQAGADASSDTAAAPLISSEASHLAQLIPSAAPVLAEQTSTDHRSGLVYDNLRPAETNYSPRVFLRESRSIPWRLGGAAAVITATGLANWNWGSSKFRFNSEGWFGRDTASLGMDKLGHAYSSYVLTEFFTDGINRSGPRSRSTSYTSAILAMGLMTYIEVFDGFSKDHGFSHEDLAMDAAGAIFSIARRNVPGLREKLDFRLLYTPSRSTIRALSCFPAPHCKRDGAVARSPITDYTGQRYLLALKLSGFKQARATPLRLLELHTGYYARGFTQEEEDRGEPLRRRIFFGAGLNVSELLFGRRAHGGWRAAKSALEYVQVPYVAIHSK